MARELRPDIILMDMSMPRMNGAEATRIIRRDVPEAEVIIVTQNDPVVVRQHAAMAGARGYVSKATLAHDLLPAILKIIGDHGGHEPAKKPKTKKAIRHWLSGGGDLGHLIREHNWSKTPLGPITRWPQSLKTAVNLMLNSQHPMWIGWGRGMTFLYNDAYISVLSLAKHPGSLGRPAREVWAEIWDVCGPLANKVFAKGEPSFLNDLRLFMNRGEYLEETYYSFSYSPIYGESGKVAGLFCPSAENTASVLHARRLRTLSELSAKALVEKTADAACASSVETISRNPDDIPFCLLYLLDADRKSAILKGTAHVRIGIDRVSPVQIRLAGDASISHLWPLNEVIEDSQPRLVPLANEDSLPLGLAGQRVAEALVLPVTAAGKGQPIGVLISGVNPARKLDVEHRTFFTLIADQVGNAIQNARAAEEEKKRIDALAEIDRAKTQFFSNVSHEFRTPLTLMLGPLEDALAAREGLLPEQRERLELAHRNSVRLLRLVNTLLDFSRLEGGGMQASYEPADLGMLTAQLASVFRSAIERAGLRLIVNCPAGEPVYVDRAMWEKIVFNLLSNAFKFTFEGEIEVSVKIFDGRAELAVRDTGTGIAGTDLPHLFERFFRVKGGRGRTFEGSGIGLSLVRELARLHGGAVGVQSELNRGSTFTVTVPLGKDHLPPDRIGAAGRVETYAQGDAYVQEALRWLPGREATTDEVPIAASRSAGQPSLPVTTSPNPRSRILLADDNADMRDYVRGLLSEEHDVEAVADGEAALEKARERRPDLILSDIMMPRLDGVGLLHAIRADNELKGVPVVLLSARAGEESRMEGLESGADDYLVKPFSARELLARVRSHLAMARVRQETAELERRLRAEAELESSRLQKLFTQAPAVICWLSGPDHRFLFVNDECLRLSGRARKEDLLDKPVAEAVPELVQQGYIEMLDRVYRTGEPQEGTEMPVVLQREGGKPYEARFNFIVQPIRNSAGEVEGILIHATEVTAHAAANRATALLAAIVGSSDDAIVSKNVDGIITSWNLGAERLFGYTATEAIGQPITLIIPPERQNEEKDILARIRRGEKTDHFETVRVRKDGTFVDISVTISPVKNSAGQVIGASKVARDITERKRAEERERRITAEAVAATAKFRAVFEQTTVFAGIMTKDGVMIEANRLCLDACGYRAEDVIGRLFWETGWWQRHPEAQEKIRAATPRVAKGIPYRELLHYSWADGTERLLDFALYPIVDDNGEVLFLHPTGVDLTDVKHAEDNYRKLAETLDAEVQARTKELEERNADVLRQSEQLQQLSWRLLRTQDDERRHVARELHDSAGQTLTVLGINLALFIQKAGRNAPELAVDAERIQEAVQQLHREIRTTSYLLHPPLLDESGLSSALEWYVQGLVERSGLDIALSIPKDFGRLPGNVELAIFRLVQECLTNIHRHSGSKTARIRLMRDAEQVTVEVSDHGKGMSAAKLGAIQSGGSGVGIRGMRERLRQFGGSLNIKSGPAGTQVQVTIPVAQPAIATDPSDDTLQAAARRPSEDQEHQDRMI